MKHKGCGGTVVEDWANPYRFEGEDAKQFGAVVPRYICSACGKENTGRSVYRASVRDSAEGKYGMKRLRKEWRYARMYGASRRTALKIVARNLVRRLKEAA